MRANHRGADVINSSKAAADISVGPAAAATQVCVRTLQRTDGDGIATTQDEALKTARVAPRRAIKDDTTLP